MRREDGFTLMEVVMAMTVGLVLLGAVFGLLESSVRLNTGVMAKTDAMQRGRLAMDTVTQQLRSQVCLDWESSAIREGSDDDSVTFFADFSAGNSKPVLRTLSYDAGSRKIVSTVTDPPSPLPNPLTPDSYADTPDAQNLVLENVVLLRDPADTTAPYDPIPFFRYYAYEEVGGVLRAEHELDTPLSKAAAARVARVEVNYFALPTGSDDLGKGVTLSDQVMARHADPNLAVPDPNCV